MTIDRTKPIDIGHSKIVLRPDGIVQVNATDHNYSVEDIKTINVVIDELTTNKKVRLLLVSSRYSSMDSETHHFLSTPESGLHSIAKAFVINSLAQRLIMNFLMKMNRSNRPVKFFTDVNSALEWLKLFDPVLSI